MPTHPMTDALAYARRGWPVFPCGPDKRPLTMHGFKDATTDSEVIRDWWVQHPDAQVAVRTGRASGVWVLDRDPAGDTAKLPGQLPDTFHVRTPRGEHWYFTVPADWCPSNARGGLPPGFDVRGEGGYAVLVGPDREVDGLAEPVAAPSWLREVVGRGASTQDGPDPFATPGDGPKTPQYALAALAGALADIAASKPGERNDTLNRAAHAVGRLVPALLDLELVRDRLVRAGLAAGLGAEECRKTVDSGLSAGMADPWDVAEEREPERPAAEERPPGAVPLEWDTFLGADLGAVEWLAGRLVERGGQAALVGEGKVGKSLFALEWAACMASGRAFLGDEEREPVRVLYVDQENGHRDIQRRVRALGFTAPELSGLVYLSFPPFGPLDTQAGADALLAVVEEHKADVVVLDTVSRMVSGKENDSEPWLALYRLTLRRLKAAGVASLRLDHFGKDTERGARGNSAKTQDVDAVWELRARERDVLTLKRTHTRTGIGPDLFELKRMGSPEESGTTRHVPTEQLRDPFVPHSVQELIQVLDFANIPVEYGRDRAKAAAREAGLNITLSDKVWSEAVRIRKERVR